MVAVIRQRVQGASWFLRETACHTLDVVRWIQGVGCHCASPCYHDDAVRYLRTGGCPSISYPLRDFASGVAMLQGGLQGVFSTLSHHACSLNPW